MIKTLAMAACAAVSMCAFGQYNSSNWDKSKDMDVNSMSMFDQRKAVEWRGNQCLSGPDQFNLAQMLDRAPMNVEKALLSGLCKSHRQAVMINDQMLAYRFPADSVTTSTTSTDNGTTTTTTTTTTLNYANPDWTAMDWSGQEASFRPMRFIMTKKDKPKSINYDQALQILTSDMGETSTGILNGWWAEKATEAQKDVIVRLLEDDASICDQTYYPSVYVHRTYAWIPNP